MAGHYFRCVPCDEEESLLHTEFMPLDRLPRAALHFVAFLIRIQALGMLTRENVEETFKGAVIRAVREHYTGKAAVLVGDEVRSTLADVSVVPREGLPLALFIGTSEPKALEATLLWSDIRARLEAEAKVTLLLQSLLPPRLRVLTVSRERGRSGAAEDGIAGSTAPWDRIAPVRSGGSGDR